LFSAAKGAADAQERGDAALAHRNAAGSHWRLSIEQRPARAPGSIDLQGIYQL
jgi:hypothetical protein